MEPATPEPNPNSNNVYPIGGIPVEFPYKPYGSQFALMAKVISTLDGGQKQGHCHALLESPTGTGKSLSLLCSALAWQQNHKSKNLHSSPYHCKPEPSSKLESSPYAKINKNKMATPTIFYATRTHSQISQLIREYRKTSYRVPMAILASRKQYCTNEYVCKKENIDDECKLLLKLHTHEGVGCSEYTNVLKVKAHPTLQKGGCHEAHDIEDLVKVGRLVKGCSYFAARLMAKEAELVFCPYNYIINKAIRRAMEIDLTDSIVILDEAHNVEDITRDVGSVDVEEDDLYILQRELTRLCSTESDSKDSKIYQPLHNTIKGVISWIRLRKSTLVKHEFQQYFSCWTGNNALRELQEVGISQQYFPILQECATKAIQAAFDAKQRATCLSGKSVIALEGLFSSLGYLFSRNGLNALDYQLVLQRHAKRDVGKKYGDWTHSLSIWCLNPAVVFREIAEKATSVILTSGTLSPMSSFSSELGVQFEICKDFPHVIDVKSQLLTAVVSTGPRNYPLNASYKTADEYLFQDELGASLEEICKIVPGGALVFFPSYNLMDKLQNRWDETGQWSRLNAQKSLFVEPRGNQESLDFVLEGYYNSISQGNGGAAFLAVCRGKVSEGIDFSDKNARVVVIVGIPFPNMHDIKVVLKKKYNDTYCLSKKLLNGNMWYCQKAFRALNQAAGRCIRHRFDYGAVIFIDERYREQRNISYLSKWLRKSIKLYPSFDNLLEGLRSFYQDVKERTGPERINTSEISDIKEEEIPSTNQDVLSKGDVKRINTNCGKLEPLTPVRIYGARLPKLGTLGTVETTDFVHADVTETVSCIECSPQKKSRLESKCAASSTYSPLQSTVKGIRGTFYNTSMSSPGVLSKKDNSDKAISPGTSAIVNTPERILDVGIRNLKSEMESPLNLGFNSYTQRRGKPMSSSLANSHMEQFRTSDGKSQDSMRSMSASKGAARRIEFGAEVGSAEYDKKLKVSEKFATNNCSVSGLTVRNSNVGDHVVGSELCQVASGSDRGEIVHVKQEQDSVASGSDCGEVVYVKQEQDYVASGSDRGEAVYVKQEHDSFPYSSSREEVADMVINNKFFRVKLEQDSVASGPDRDEVAHVKQEQDYVASCSYRGEVVHVKQKYDSLASGSDRREVVYVKQEHDSFASGSGRGEVADLALNNKFSYVKHEQDSVASGFNRGEVVLVKQEQDSVASGSDRGEVTDLVINNKFSYVKQEQDSGA